MLAARSAEAAKETKGLIEGSIDKVEVGSRIADETAESLKEILNEIEQVTSLAGNIAQASNDQASEIAQITKGIDQVSQVVQANSAMAEESTAASEELSGQAEMLKQIVGIFELKSIGQIRKNKPDLKKRMRSKSKRIFLLSPKLCWMTTKPCRCSQTGLIGRAFLKYLGDKDDDIRSWW